MHPDYDALMQRDHEQLKSDVMRVLKARPKNSAKQDDMAKHVLADLGVKGLRGEKRKKFAKHVNEAVGALKRMGEIEEYRSKNTRVRLRKR
jgi:hypothetical protein